MIILRTITSFKTKIIKKTRASQIQTQK